MEHSVQRLLLNPLGFVASRRSKAKRGAQVPILFA
jgi:hypothetical protein